MLAKGFRVGPIEVNPPLVLAPMEDVTNLPFRLIAKRIAGPGLVFTEFVSAMAVHYKAAKTFKKMKVHPAERPMAIQIFGSEPETMVETALIAEEFGADIIDINMGCWVPKVCRQGAGAALLKDPDNASAIVGAVAKAVKVPVTVKVRAGWDYSLFAAPDLARRFQDVGAQMITLHARFAKQGFEGEADWDLIKRMREHVTVPLIGNGDVKTPDDATKMIRETGCDGVMVGRAAISNPWLLKDIACELKGLPIPPAPSLGERTQVALEHLKLMIAHEAETDTYEEAQELQNFREKEIYASRHLRGQIPMYIKGYPGAAVLRERLTKCNSYGEYEELLGRFVQEADII